MIRMMKKTEKVPFVGMLETSLKIVRSERIQEVGNDTFIEPLGIWPTDHKGVLVTFEPIRKN